MCLGGTIHGRIYTGCTAGARGEAGRNLPGTGRRRRKKKSKRDGKAWTDMYEAASQAGGERVQGQARQRQQTPVLEDERAETRCAPENGMDRACARGKFAIDRRFAGEGGSGEYARDAIPEMAWNEATIWRACTKKHTRRSREGERELETVRALGGGDESVRCRRHHDTIRHDDDTRGALAGWLVAGTQTAAAGRQTGSILPGGG